MAVLSLSGLTVSFQTDGAPVRAVRGIGFDVQPGEVVAVVGESGSGKSVSSRAVLGLLPETASVDGSAILRTEGDADRELIGMRAADLRPIRGDEVSMVFQEPGTALNPVRTVGWQIIEGLQAHELEQRVDYYPHQLSGGQKQRVVIAMAISCDPDVIIADEPTTALDVTVQAAILELLLSLRDRLGTAIILITHNMGVVADMADRVVVMYRGEIVEQAPVDQLFSAPAHPYTRALLDAVPHLGQEDGPGLLDESGDVVLDVDHLVVEFPGGLGRPAFRAVDDVSLQIRRGEVLGLVGESGSGKSTIGRATVGLQQPTSGTISVSGPQRPQGLVAQAGDLRARDRDGPARGLLQPHGGA
ncbi:MAG: ABC transporter ATP-binding protein, partial [Actinomycetales bacterium]